MCDSEYTNVLRPCGFQHFLYFTHRCAGGAHIVNNHHAPSAHVLRLFDRKTIFYILKPRFFISKRCLARRVFYFLHYIRSRLKRTVFVKSCRFFHQPLCLVPSALPQFFCRKWHGDKQCCARVVVGESLVLSAPGSATRQSAHKKVPSFLHPTHFSGKRRLRIGVAMRVKLKKSID